VQADDLAFFEVLASVMNADPARFRPLGEAYMSAGVVMRGARGDFRARLDFDGLRCEVSPWDGASPCDYWLEGPTAVWEQMFANITGNGRAVGLETVNSLVMLGDDIRLQGRDPMGLDKFSRFNQTLQEFLDGAARLPERVPAS